MSHHPGPRHRVALGDTGPGTEPCFVPPTFQLPPQPGTELPPPHFVPQPHPSQAHAGRAGLHWPSIPFYFLGCPPGHHIGEGGEDGGGGVSVHSPHPDLGGVRVWRGSGHALSSAGAAPCRGTGVRGVAVTPPDPSGCQGGYGRRWGSWGGVESNVPFASGKGAHEGPRLCPWGAGVQGGEGAAGGGGGARAAPCPSQPGAAIPWPWRRVPYRSRVPLGCPRGSGCREGVQGRSRPPP